MNVRTLFSVAAALVGLWFAMTGIVGAVGGLTGLIFMSRMVPASGFGGLDFLSLTFPLIPGILGTLLLFLNRFIVELMLNVCQIDGNAPLPKMDLRPLCIACAATLGLYFVTTGSGMVARTLLEVILNGASPRNRSILGNTVGFPEFVGHAAAFAGGLVLIFNPHRVADFILRRVQPEVTPAN